MPRTTKSIESEPRNRAERRHYNRVGAAEYTSLSVATIDRFAHLIGFAKIRGRKIFRQDDLDAFIERHYQSPIDRGKA